MFVASFSQFDPMQTTAERRPRRLAAAFTGAKKYRRL